MLKLANPLQYPLAVLVSGIILIIGVRFLGIANTIILPTSAAIALSGATWLKLQEPDENKLYKKQLEQELQAIKFLSQQGEKQAELLRQEANQLLTKTEFQLDLLVIINSACDRAVELPRKIEQLAEKISANESLLSSQELQKQLLDVKLKISSSSGITRQHLEKLATQLEENIRLAEVGKDTRQAQILNLHTLIQDSAGSLQQLQNQLRTADLTDSEEIKELNVLTEELQTKQEQFNLLIE